MPYCCKCKQEKENMKSAKTCIKSNFFTLEETKAAVQAVLDLRNLTSKF